MNNTPTRLIAAKRLAVAVAAVCATLAAPAFATDDVKNVLDLMLKKGMITQQDYDQFMKDNADAAENKQFKEKRGSFGFGAENFLMKEMVIRNEIVTPSIVQNSTSRLQNLNFKINFNYRIGKMSLNQAPKKRKSITNDDLKDGGEGQGEQGGAPVRNN